MEWVHQAQDMNKWLAFVDKVMNFYVTHFRAYDQYNKTGPTSGQYCLFIFCIYLFPDMFRQVAMPLSRGPYHNYIKCA
jgi:hypothetical protein